MTNAEWMVQRKMRFSNISVQRAAPILENNKDKPIVELKLTWGYNTVLKNFTSVADPKEIFARAFAVLVDYLDEEHEDGEA